ncbi:MAG: CHAD domain-containing protein [Desulfobulbaceae bacterium]|nr:MAG: CHAD domain-containing protein [Desulfobulbaceae bacterium]
MMIEKVPSSTFVAPTGIEIASLAERLGDGYAVGELEPEEVREEYLDTFEWRLLISGRALARSGRRYRLFSADGTLLGEGRGPRKKRPFWWNFQEGPLRDDLIEDADIRALCPKLQLVRHRRFFQLLNEDEKTVLRLRLERTIIPAGASGPADICHLHLTGIRGYDQEFQTVLQLMREDGLEEIPNGTHFLVPILARAGIDVDSHGSKTAILLPRDISIRGGLRQAGLAVLSDIRRNLPGTVDDIDTEFLHDLRISLRRTRSLLSIFAKKIPGEQGRHFRAEFRWITQTTGNVRDSDVYLLQEDDYRKMLPTVLHPGLTGFVRGMREYRNREFRSMRKSLKSQRFTRLLGQWQHFLENLPEEAAEEAGLCRVFAARAVKKRFRKLIARGEDLGPDSPPAALHALRIEVKKLRYLLEFFHSLFPPEEVELLIKHMKKLQNNLGEFNDLSVQQVMLGTFRSPGRNGEPQQALAVAAALGGLMTRLFERQQQVRGEFEAIFADFACAENRELVQTIVRAGGVGPPGEAAGRR